MVVYSTQITYKNGCNFLRIAFLLLCGLVATGCTSTKSATGGGSKSTTPANDIKSFIIGDEITIERNDLATLTAAVKGYLENKSPTENKADAPIVLTIAGLDLSNKAQLGALYAGITRYVELDLTSCYGDKIVYADDADRGKSKTNVVSISLPLSVNSLPKDSNSVNGIRVGSFSGFTNLKSINMPGVRTISSRAFSACIALNSIDLSKVTSIEENSFARCISLISVDLSSIDTISGEAFSDCSKLTEINIDPKNTKYVAEGPMILSKDKTTLVAYINAEGEISLPATIKTIDAVVFANSAITVVNAPGVLTIKPRAFYNCRSLISIDLPNATVIGDSAFIFCQELVSINLPKVVTIGIFAFRNCTNLKTVNIPSIESIVRDSFSDCPALVSITMGEKAPVLNYYYNAAFADKSANYSIIVPTESAAFYGDNVDGWTEEVQFHVIGHRKVAIIESANAMRDRKDYTGAIAQYRAILKLYPYDKQAQDNMIAVWNKRIAENKNLYPAPFNGTWKYVIPSHTGPERTETYYTSETYYAPKTYYQDIYGYPLKEPYTGTEKITSLMPHTRTLPPLLIPEQTITYTFSGTNYTFTSVMVSDPEKDVTPITQKKTGTFFYNGATIELDDGTILQFRNNAMTDGEKHSYSKQ